MTALADIPTDLWAFEGAWRVTRRIADARGPDGGFDGQAVFSRHEGGLRYVERGTLMLGEAAFQAERQYRWTPDGSGGVAVWFADGRAFHSFALGPTAQGQHACDPDSYAVSYTFADWPIWHSRWHVTGPRKDYVMTTTYARAD